MTRNIDELSNLQTRSVEPEKYFGEMDLDEEQVEKRIEYTKKANELFDIILILLLTMRDNGEVDYSYARTLLETWLLSLIAEFTTPDDYLIDYASDTAFNFVDTTQKNIDKEWYTSSDRALFNAENSANDVLNYSEYEQAIKEGKTHKQWITESDNRVRESHKDVIKKPIPIKEYFRVGMAKMRFPKDYEYAAAFPEELVNCRCTIQYLPKDKENAKKSKENDESKQNRVDDFEIKQYNLGGDEGKAKYNPQTNEYEAFIKNSKVYDFFLKPGAKHFIDFAEAGYSLDDPNRLFLDIFTQFDENKLIIDKAGKGFVEGYQIMYLGTDTKKRFKTAWRKDDIFKGLPRITSGYRNDK